jgi:hypothetical protein
VLTATRMGALIAGVFLLTVAPAFSQASIRGAWMADVDGTRHIYVFKVRDDVVSGTYCTRCDDIDNIAVIRNGRIVGDRLSFSLLSSQAGGRWGEQKVEGSFDGRSVVLRGVPSVKGELRLIRGARPPRPAAAAAAAAPPPYVAPGPPERLTLESMAGTWISGTGPRAQIAMLKVLDGKLVGLICGPCDAPWVMAPIEDGVVAGDRVTLYTVHEDGGGMFEKIGPYRNQLVGMVSKHQLRVNAHVDGRPGENVINMTFIGPVRK